MNIYMREGKVIQGNQMKELDPVFKVIIYLYIFSVPIGMIKIFHINNLAFVYINFFYIVMLLLSLIFIYKMFTLRDIKLDIFSLFLVILLTYGFLMGLINNNDLKSNIIDSGRLIFVISIYLYFINRKTNYIELEVFLYVLSKWLLITYSVIILFSYLYAIPNGMIGYFSIASQRLMIPLVYFMEKKPILSFFSFSLILLSGKRGVLISSIILIIVILLFRTGKVYRTNPILKLTTLFFSLTLLSVILFLFKPELLNLDLLFNRWAHLLPWSDAFNLRLASAGRFEEIIGVFNSMKSDQISYLIGAGNGYEYSFDYLVGSQIFSYQDYRNVHISFINLIMLYGCVNTLIFYAFLIYKYQKSYQYLKRYNTEHNKTMLIVLFSSIGLILYTFFAYELLQEALIWIFMGILTRYVIENKSYKKLS